MSRPPHVCCLCSKRHKPGAKTYDPTRVRCTKNCTRKPVVARPHSWVGKGACAFCGAVTPRGSRRCTNREKCVVRALSGMRVLKYDDDWTRAEYDAAMTVAAPERMAA